MADVAFVWGARRSSLVPGDDSPPIQVCGLALKTQSVPKEKRGIEIKVLAENANTPD
jgi:hypothetical protein